jgi:hypothetical protein
MASHSGKRAWGPKGHRNTPCARVKRRADCKKDLQICGAGRKLRERPTLFVSKKPNGKSQVKGKAMIKKNLLEKKNARGTQSGTRCLTRALKNAHYIQKAAPHLFAKDAGSEGFGTGIPMEILRGLHRIRHDSPVLSRHKAVAEFLKENRLPVPGNNARDPLFSGTIHFAQVTFKTTAGNFVMPTADMNMIVQYAKHAIVPISEYAAKYGANTVSVSPNLITYSANVLNASYTDADLQSWINDMVSTNGLSSETCIFVISPQGINAPNVGGNSGYHGKANVPYIVAGVYANGLTLQDIPDVYAMVVSHEIAEMVVDPNVDGNNPEVCDPCDINCNNLTRIYFDATNAYLGANQQSPPAGFNFSYYICAVVRPSSASACPAPGTDCAYPPSTSAAHFPGIYYTEIAQILVGIINDGGGIEIIGGHIVHVPPWPGPVLDILLAAASLKIGSLVSGEQGVVLQKAALTAITQIAQQGIRQLEKEG